MKVSLNKSEVSGKITVPPSKSYTIRGLMCAALAKGASEIVHPLLSDDTEAAADVLQKIGVDVQKSDNSWRVNGGHFRRTNSELFCGDSAATLRFMTAICSLMPGESRLTAGSSLSQRPIKPLLRSLDQLGVKVTSDEDHPPVTVVGGRLKAIETDIPGNVSSQFISALLLIAPFAERGLRIRLTKPLESRPYVMMTLLSLRKFGIQVTKLLDKFIIERQIYPPAIYEVEGDWSSASYFLALGALCGDLELENLSSASWQGDRVMMDYLRDMGAGVEVVRGSIKVQKSDLKPLRVNLSDSIDLLPTVAVLAAAAKGESVFTGITRATLKESDRLNAIQKGLKNMGISVGLEKDRMTIIGGELKGAEIDSKGDHRIAMAFGVLGLMVGDTVIDGAECVSKTYPQFWDVLKSIGGEVHTDV